MHNPRNTISQRMQRSLHHCHSPVARSPFRQLGRQSPDGEETPPSHRNDHDQKSGGGNHPNFRSCATMQRFRLDWRCLLGSVVPSRCGVDGVGANQAKFGWQQQASRLVATFGQFSKVVDAVATWSIRISCTYSSPDFTSNQD